MHLKLSSTKSPHSFQVSMNYFYSILSQLFPSMPRISRRPRSWKPIWLHKYCGIQLGMNIIAIILTHHGLFSLNGKTSYLQISWSLEAARLGVMVIVSLWNLTGISAAVLPRCLSNFRAIRKFKIWISRLRDFVRSSGKTSTRLVNRSPGLQYIPRIMHRVCVLLFLPWFSGNWFCSYPSR